VPTQALALPLALAKLQVGEKKHILILNYC
jgi:hypothetical protein